MSRLVHSRHVEWLVRLVIFLVALYCFLGAIEMFGHAMKIMGKATAESLFSGLSNPFAALAGGCAGHGNGAKLFGHDKPCGRRGGKWNPVRRARSSHCYGRKRGNFDHQHACGGRSHYTKSLVPPGLCRGHDSRYFQSAYGCHPFAARTGHGFSATLG